MGLVNSFEKIIEKERGSAHGISTEKQVIPFIEKGARTSLFVLLFTYLVHLGSCVTPFRCALGCKDHLVICLARLGVIFLLRKSDIASSCFATLWSQ